MRKRHLSILTAAGLFAALLLFCCPAWSADKVTAEELVAKHLDSIGTAAARDGVKSRVGEGAVQFSEIIANKIQMQGKAQVVSLGRKVKASMQFGQPSYPGEQFVFDGQSAQVAMTDPGARSALGNFLYTQTEIMNDGLMGGTVFTSWPLLALKEHQAKLKYEGLKKVEGRQLHELTYIPKKRAGSGDLTIKLYFEADTFRHVKSVYELLFRDNETRQTVEERFADFQTVDGLTLPRQWQIRFRKEPSNTPQELQWDIRLAGFAHNTLN